jgi:hypothetical protein
LKEERERWKTVRKNCKCKKRMKEEGIVKGRMKKKERK